jgi:hypothetical protein
MGLCNSYKLFIAIHQPVNGGDAHSASRTTVLDRDLAVCIYWPAGTQPSSDFVLALIFGYVWLMWETKKALYTRVLRRYPIASKQSVRINHINLCYLHVFNFLHCLPLEFKATGWEMLATFQNLLNFPCTTCKCRIKIRTYHFITSTQLWNLAEHLN